MKPKRVSLLLLILSGCALLLGPRSASASSGGIANSWGFSSATGCMNCHSNGVGTPAPTEASFTGATSVSLGSTTKYTITVNVGIGAAAGINVTAWSPAGGAALGTLSLCNSGTDANCGSLQVVSSQITHTVRHFKNPSNDVTFAFNYTAPLSAPNCAQDKLEIWINNINNNGTATGDQAARFDHFIALPCATPTPVDTPTVTPADTPTATPTPNGFVPPDKNTLTCQKKLTKALGKLGACLRACHVKAATAALQGKSFDEVACATGTPEKSCRAKFDLASQKLLAKGICPACLDDAHQAALADRVTAEVESETADVYCAGSVPLP